jgi:hypothetical protein
MSGYISQEWWLEILVDDLPQCGLPNAILKSLAIALPMISNAEPLANLLSCSPEAEVFLPDSADGRKAAVRLTG